jgi:hypothetical protein
MPTRLACTLLLAVLAVLVMGEFDGGEEERSGGGHQTWDERKKKGRGGNVAGVGVQAFIFGPDLPYLSLNPHAHGDLTTSPFQPRLNPHTHAATPATAGRTSWGWPLPYSYPYTRGPWMTYGRGAGYGPRAGWLGGPSGG